ncbi:peptide ABC transporter substrate-binding protein [Phycisphaera mikurensis]|uniref:Putative ABC transporter substrate binding protein n=1 Tax=Phycisphaera mikurensis (strain NBRC 102666 / KCTC 22515 / FYK2301M01) TaxID=1142394 RepID=I0IH28_PHYMF|nr:peptide ABC transporter substrate-binding protein [Phycisphaera mikurensis]MBB6440821.1 oligopeptide transport system substrate-binding protein [Phycisphaera mikurensis]BAM04566.1 putative ABC transporter substrate binding protein [Phycisphaera mikurensis NBRC 102666]
MKALRRRSRATLAVLAVSAAAGLVLAATLGSASSAPSTDAFRYSVQVDCITLDPQNTSSLVDFRVIETIYEGLLAVEPGSGALRPAAASLPEVSADGRTLTFRLDPAARWCNGDPVTSGDFAFAWTRSLATDFAAVYGGLFDAIDGAEAASSLRDAQLEAYRPGTDDPEALWHAWLEAARGTVGLDASDPAVLVVRLARPVAYFPQLTAFGVFAPNHRPTVEAALSFDGRTGRVFLDADAFNDPDRAVTNGPYRLAAWEHRRRIVLEANPHHAASPATPRVVQDVVEDNDPLRLARGFDGDADWVPDLGGDLAVRLIEAGTPGVITIPRAGLEYVSLNCRDTVGGRANPLADPRVRRALALAVDRDTLVAGVSRLNEPPIGSFVPPGAVAGYPAGPAAAAVSAPPAFDPEAARALLAEAGFPGGAGLPPLRYLHNASPSHTKKAVWLANQWERHLGVRVVVESLEWRVYLARRRAGDFHLSRSGWYGDYRDPTTWLDLLRAGDPNNDTGYASPAFAEALAAAGAETEPNARLVHLTAAEAVMLADQPVIPLHQAVGIEWRAPGVTGLVKDPWSTLELEKVRRPSAPEGRGTGPRARVDRAPGPDPREPLIAP